MSRPFRRPKKAFQLFIITVLLGGLFAYYNETQTPKDAPTAPANSDPALSEQRAAHILTGDQTGGGHLFGAAKPCKSEFPSSWDEGKILSAVKEIAANDNLPWEKQSNGYYVAESRKDGVRVRVVLNQNRTQIITGYPTNMPRNPCPRAANDNYNR
jgi:Bacterial EndoU nuclease